MVVLDTDIIIGVLRNDAQALSAFQRYHRKERIIISSVTWYELMIGCGKRNQLAEVVECLAEAAIMHVDDTVATLAARFALLLEKSGTPIGIADQFIAASCAIIGETLVTRNIRHFEKIPGLKVEAW